MDMLNDTKGIRHQATELIEQAYHKGYKAGVEDGRKLYEESGIFKPRNSAAEIVYCKDCNFMNEKGICEKLWTDDGNWNYIFKRFRPFDHDYCSLGRRKE